MEILYFNILFYFEYDIYLFRAGALILFIVHIREYMYYTILYGQTGTTKTVEKFIAKMFDYSAILSLGVFEFDLRT